MSYQAYLGGSLKCVEREELLNPDHVCHYKVSTDPTVHSGNSV